MAIGFDFSFYSHLHFSNRTFFVDNLGEIKVLVRKTENVNRHEFIIIKQEIFSQTVIRIHQKNSTHIISLDWNSETVKAHD